MGDPARLDEQREDGTVDAPFHLAGFEPIKRLGGGGFGDVWLAMQINIQRRVAIKFGHNVIADDTVRLRFERECRALGRLSGHRHIMDVVLAGHLDDGRPYLVLEYVGGGTLWHRAQDRPLEEAEVLRIGVELAEALEAAHRAGVLHRDVKPENVLLRENGDTVLGDFGIARLHDGAYTTSRAIAASVAYAAPEILEAKQATEAADIYGLGVCLLAAMIRQVPFVERSDESIQPVIRRVLTERPPDIRRHGYSDELALVIENFLSKDPAKRPASATMARQMLESLRTGGMQANYHPEGAGAPIPPLTSPPAEPSYPTPSQQTPPQPPIPAVAHHAGGPQATGYISPEWAKPSDGPRSLERSRQQRPHREPAGLKLTGPLPILATVGAVLAVAGLAVFIAFQTPLFDRGTAEGDNLAPAAGGLGSSNAQTALPALPLSGADLNYQVVIQPDDEQANAREQLYCANIPQVGPHQYSAASLDPLATNPWIYQQLMAFDSPEAAAAYLAQVVGTVDCNSWERQIPDPDSGQSNRVEFTPFVVQPVTQFGDETIEITMALHNLDTGDQFEARTIWVRQGATVFSLNVSHRAGHGLELLDELLAVSLGKLQWS